VSGVDSNPKRAPINAKQLRCFVAPVWHEINSLWSGVDFSFSDPLPDSAEQLDQALLAGSVAHEPHSGVNQRHYQHCS
jgi:hypothetical protein